MNFKMINPTIVMLLSAYAAMFSGCNVAERAGLRVAGGTIDGSDGVQRYPGTVYVELRGKDFNGEEAIIRNVGTIADVGLGDSYALFLSLADVFQSVNGSAVLPVMKEVSIKLYMSNGRDEVLLPALKMNNSGFLVDDKQKPSLMMAVGVKAQKVGRSDSSVDRFVSGLAAKLFLDSPLYTEKGGDFRDANTSYVIISIPKDSHPALASLKVPSVITAEQRPDAATLKGVVVGFGENSVGGSKKKEFSLSESLPSVMKRNYKDIESLNKSVSEYTPLRQLIGSSSSTAQVLWEFTGSGLCGSKNGSNYDTGAGIYINDKFAGLSVRSTAISTGFKGRLDCASTTLKDMVTLVVSPTASEIQQFVTRAKGQ
jgi:hypothetical protein